MSRKQKTPFPSVPLQLLEVLETRFPDRIPDSIPTASEAAALVGEQRVLRLLRREYEAQSNPKEV